MTPLSRERILEDLTPLLRTFNEREYSGDITTQTRFLADLGLVSIDAVVLGEQIEEHYGRKIPFHLFLAELRDSGTTDAEVGQLVEFLHRQLNSTQTEGELCRA